MALEDRSIHGSVASESVPGREASGAVKRARFSNYGEQLTTPVGKNGVYGLANEGSYFLGFNGTVGTGIAGIAAADGYDETETLLFLRNSASAAEGKRIYLDFIRLSCTAVGANGTTTGYAATIDNGNDRYTSGGTAITPVNCNMQSTDTASATMYFGPVVTAAANGSRRVANQELRSVIKVAADTTLFDFGGPQRYSEVSSIGTAILQSVIPCPPVVLGPGDMFMLHEFAASQSGAASYEFECGFWVR
jgi:hypothetical protein